MKINSWLGFHTQKVIRNRRALSGIRRVIQEKQTKN